MAGVTLLAASDHAGLEMKNALVEACREKGIDVEDLGCHAPESVDYPDFADALARAMLERPGAKGLLVCGTGIGISIAANRHNHIRCALSHDVTTAILAREHNDANVLALGSRIIGTAVASACLHAFMATEFAGGRHQRRVAKLAQSG